MTFLPKIEDSEILRNPIEIKKIKNNFYASTCNIKSTGKSSKWSKKTDL